jgi:hypothetical protein
MGVNKKVGVNKKAQIKSNIPERNTGMRRRAAR